MHGIVRMNEMDHNMEKDGWQTWSKHILNALERLDKQIESLRGDLNKTNLDIAKLNYINKSLLDIEEKIAQLKEDIITQGQTYREAITSLEADDASNMKDINERFEDVYNSINDLEVFATRTKTIGWIIGAVITALLGMLSISIRDLFRQ